MTLEGKVALVTRLPRRADAVLFVLTRPWSHRILETAFRPTTESSWG